MGAAVRRYALPVLVALLATSAGCSVIGKPDRDAIVPDWDAGMDSGMDAGDADRDGGDDAGDSDVDACVPSQAEDCTNERDDDCDGQTDCFDFDCRGFGGGAAATCCRGAELRETCLDSTSTDGFIRLPADEDIQFDSVSPCRTRAITSFDVATDRVRALVSRECQPINFGMHYTTQFILQSMAPACAPPGCPHRAALSFGLVQQLVDGEDYASEFRFVVEQDGSARAERAGTSIGTEVDAGTLLSGAAVPITLDVELEPGPDESGHDVLFVTAILSQGEVRATLLNRAPIMPLSDLTCFFRVGTSATGLFAVIEGAGTEVRVRGPMTLTRRACANPSQFLPQPTAVTLDGVAGCGAEGAAAPALVDYCYSDCDTGSPSIQWDLWLDGSERPREDDELDFIELGVCGYTSLTDTFPTGVVPEEPWDSRSDTTPPYQFDPGHAAREPTILPVPSSGRVETLWYAYARRPEARSDGYEIHGGTLDRGTSMVPDDGDLLLAPFADCEALRDPLLLADWSADGASVVGAWLLFTCDRFLVPDSIGSARVERDSGTGQLAVVPGTEVTDYLTSAVGDYAARGVFAPEGFTEASGEDITLRLWFMSRAGPEPEVSFAQGRGPRGGLPSVDAYPANPVLSSDSPLFLQDCTTECRVTGLSVTPIVDDEDHYQFLVSRSRTLVGGGFAYELVPLLQPRPRD